MVEREILQFVRADSSLRRLPAAIATRHQLGGNLRVENARQYARYGRPQSLGTDHPTQDLLNHGLGKAGIDAVVAHVVANAKRAPSKRQLREIPSTHNDPVVLPR